MKVAVTGSTGFAGGHALAALTAAGHTVRALARSDDKLKRVEALHGLDPVERVIGDVTEPDTVADLLDGCDAVIHSAAVVATSRSMNRLMQATNEPAARLVLETAAETGLDPIVHVSSVAAIHPAPGGEYSSDCPLSSAPAGMYAETKVASERIARRLQADGAPVIIVWPSGIAGPADVGLSVSAGGTARLLSTGVLPIPPTGGNLMHDVRDLAEVLARCMAPGLGPRRFGVFGHFLSWPEMADMVTTITGTGLRTPSVSPRLLRGVGSFGNLLGLLGIPFPLDAAAANFMTQTMPGDDSDTRAALDIEWRPIAETMSDMLRWLISAGHLDASKAPALAG